MYQYPEVLTSPWAVMCSPLPPGPPVDLPELLQKPWPAPIRKPLGGAEGFEVNPEDSAPFTEAF